MLFSNTTELFNVLGSWVYGGRDGKLVYSALVKFLENQNKKDIVKFNLSKEEIQIESFHLAGSQDNRKEH